MTDDDVRKRIAEWVGIPWRGPRAIYRLDPGVGSPVSDYEPPSDADLAEAARRNYVSQYPISECPVPDDPWPDCVRAWGSGGPIAFCRAVLEVVDD